jgi:hypothetical protein
LFAPVRIEFGSGLLGTGCGRIVTPIAASWKRADIAKAHALGVLVSGHLLWHADRILFVVHHKLRALGRALQAGGELLLAQIQRFRIKVSSGVTRFGLGFWWVHG